MWNPVRDGNKCLRVKLESVQRKAVRYVFNDWRKTSSVSAMINNLGWPLLEEKRKILNLLMLHKIINQKVDIPLSFLPKRLRSSNTRFQPVIGRVNSFKNSFVPTTISWWNDLPANVVNERNYDHFKILINNTN